MNLKLGVVLIRAAWGYIPPHIHGAHWVVDRWRMWLPPEKRTIYGGGGVGG